MAKLTDAQRKVLARMEAGETLYVTRGWGSANDHYWLANNFNRVHGKTVSSLKANGYIVGNSQFISEEYSITDAGRAALEQE